MKALLQPLTIHESLVGSLDEGESRSMQDADQGNSNRDKTDLSNKVNCTKTKGPEYMAMRWNILQKKKEIRRDIQPLDNFLLDDLIEGTVNKWVSESEFDVEDLAAGLKTGTNRVYASIKKMHAMGLITKRETRYKRRLILGLNPNFFGQILIDHQHQLEKKKHLRLVSIGTQEVPKETEEVPNGTGPHPKRDSRGPDRDLNDLQLIDSKQENFPYLLIDFISSFNGDFKKLNLKDSEYLFSQIMEYEYMRYAEHPEILRTKAILKDRIKELQRAKSSA
jgi:hypothetical protein